MRTTLRSGLAGHTSDEEFRCGSNNFKYHRINEANLTALNGLARHRLQDERDRLRSKPRMLGRQANRSRLFSRADPDRTRPADQRKRIVSDDLCRTFKSKDNRIVGVSADGVKRVRYSQNYAG